MSTCGSPAALQSLPAPGREGAVSWVFCKWTTLPIQCGQLDVITEFTCGVSNLALVRLWISNVSHRFLCIFHLVPADSTVWEEMSEACLIGGGTLGEDFWGDDNLVLILVSCHVGRHNCTVLQPQMTQQPRLPTCDGLYP